MGMGDAWTETDRTRRVEPPALQVVVTEHVYLERHCPGCCRPGTAGQPDCVLREEARLLFATIQYLLQS